MNGNSLKVKESHGVIIENPSIILLDKIKTKTLLISLKIIKIRSSNSLLGMLCNQKKSNSENVEILYSEKVVVNFSNPEADQTAAKISFQ